MAKEQLLKDHKANFLEKKQIYLRFTEPVSYVHKNAARLCQEGVLF